MSPAARLSQRQIYENLRKSGSSWLRKHVLYADRQMVVLNKPPGLVCQLDHRSDNECLTQTQNLTVHFRDIRAWLSSDPHHVHRLDKGTTGCLLLATNHTAAKALSQQLRQGTIHKRYLALVQGDGRLLPGTEGQLSNFLSYRNGRGTVSTNGKLAITKWKLLASSLTVPLSLLQLDLLTGNKHQIRLHLSQTLKTPILGDDLYGDHDTINAICSRIAIPNRRIFLHASELSLLKYGDNGRRYRLDLRSPMPSDFKRLCEKAGLGLPGGLDRAALSVSEARVPLDDQPQLWIGPGSSLSIPLQVQNHKL